MNSTIGAIVKICLSAISSIVGVIVALVNGKIDSSTDSEN